MACCWARSARSASPPPLLPPPRSVDCTHPSPLCLHFFSCSNWAECGWFEGRVAQVDLGRDLLPGEDNPDEDINPNAIYLNIE